MQRVVAFVIGLFVSISSWAGNVELDIPSEAIALVYFHDQDVQLTLTPEARKLFENFTQENLNETLSLSVDGVHAQKATIYSVVTSGLLRVDKPSDKLMEILRELPQKEL